MKPTAVLDQYIIYPINIYTFIFLTMTTKLLLTLLFIVLMMGAGILGVKQRYIHTEKGYSTSNKVQMSPKRVKLSPRSCKGINILA